MTRRSHYFGFLAGLGIAASLVGCDDTSTVAPNTLNLARPVDVAFTCYGGLRLTGGTTDTAGALSATPTAQPTTSCNIRSAERFVSATDSATILASEPRPPGQQDVSGSTVGTATWYGFILQSASGTLALANFASKPSSTFVGSSSDVLVRDVDPLTPGKNSISVGEDPVGLETDKSGCYEVVANGGSCDLSSLDVNSVLGNLDGTQATPPIVKRLPITKPNGDTIYARPAAIVGEEGDAVIGNACPAQPSGIAYVAFPGCHMVAALDLSAGDTAKITAAIQFDAAGVATVVTGAALDGLSCPVECSSSSAPLDAPTAGTRPVALAYRFDPTGAIKRRLAIGASNSPIITVANLTDAYDSTTYKPQPQPLPTTIKQLTLEHAAGTTLGVSQLALSPEVALGGVIGAATPDGQPGTGGNSQFVYAVTTDHTVRVAEVTMTNAECDTQVDQRFLQPGMFGADIKALSCLPVAAKLPRRPTARGPGIQLPDEGTPTSVAFFQPTRAYSAAGVLETPASDPTALLGTFAVVTSTAGPSYIVNVDDNNKTVEAYDATKPFESAPVLVMAHQLRRNASHPGEGSVKINYDSSGNEVSTTPQCTALGIGNRGAPRITGEPTQTAGGGTAATGSTAAAKALELPTLREDVCGGTSDATTPITVSEMVLAAPESVRKAVFPDIGGMLSDQSFSMVWEGQLSVDSGHAANGPTVRVGQWVTNSTASASLNDQSQPFCALGAEVGDIVQMQGCDPSLKGLDCPQGYQCYVHGDTEYTLAGSFLGSCLKSDDIDRLASACRDFLVSSRRFTVRYTSAGQLELSPRLHELRTTPLDGCTDDTQCEALADYSIQNSLEEFSDSNKDAHNWACREDPTRKPFLNGSTKRCVEVCEQDAQCDVGSVCDDGVCKEGVIPPQACMAAPQRFSIRAGEAFALLSDVRGYISPLIKDPNDANGKCIVNPKYSDPKVLNLQISRIPLDAPACDPVSANTDPVTGMRANGTFEPNPCATTVTSYSNEPVYTAGTCTSTGTAVTQRMNVPAIKLRTQFATLTMVDPYYPGDAKCPLDRAGAPQIGTGERIPLVFPSYQLGFHLTGGLTPLQLQYSSSFNPVFPVKVVEGPTGSIWVLDDGDYLSSTLGLASTEGSVFRVEGRSIGIVNQLQ